MALIGNGVRLSTINPMRQRGANSAGTITRASWGTPGSLRNTLYGDGEVVASYPYSGLPSGYRHPASWSMPQKTGGLSSRYELDGSGTVSSANLAAGMYINATLTGSGTISNAATEFFGRLTSTLNGSGAIVPPVIAGALAAAATLTGSGTITTASLSSVVAIAATLLGSGAIVPPILAGVLNAAATLSGTGTITTASLAGALLASATLLGSGTLSADIKGKWEMQAALTGSGSLAADVQGIADMVATIIGTGTFTPTIGAQPTNIEALLTPFTELSPQNLAAAVWNSLVATFQEAGSMGEALATAGSGGLSPTQVTMLTELYRLAGLDATRPRAISPDAIDAGAEIHIEIVEAPAGTFTGTRIP